jgi:hypothetical protein
MPDRPASARPALWVAGLFATLYVGNVLLGKLAAIRGELDAWHAGNVVEALFLFLAVIAFVIAALRRERQEAAEGGPDDAPSQ